MSDLGFVVKPVLIIDAKATEHILHRHGIGKMKHIDVAHVCCKDEVKSNRLRVRRVKSEDNLADIGTKALSNRIIRKHAISMVYVDVQENLRSGDVLGLWVDGIRARTGQSRFSSRKRHGVNVQRRWRGQPNLAESAKRDDSKPDVSPSCGPFPHQWIVTVSFSPSYVGFWKNWFVVSTKFLVDDDVVVETTDASEAQASLNRRRQHGADNCSENLFARWTATRFIRRLRWSGSKSKDS